MATTKHVHRRKTENSGTPNCSGQKIKNKKFEVLGQTKPRCSFWLKTNFRKMASNKHVFLKRKENFVRSKCFPEDISKDKGKKANFWIF